MKKTDSRLERISRMEAAYDEVTGMMGKMGEAVNTHKDFKSKFEELKEYMDSGQWQKDYEADEAGKIPAYVKRGVLSQDGLYDLLQDVDDVLGKTQEATMPDSKIASAEDMEHAIRQAGIIPFFINAIPGYSIQELTAPGFWFGGEEDSLGPWDWKIHCIQCGDIAYGKFLCGGKAAFATIPLYRELMNVRRAAYEPDENGRKVLELLDRQGTVTMREIRTMLKVKKAAADTVIRKLEHQCRVVTGDMLRVYKGPELSYKGWQTASFCTPDALFEDEGITLDTGHSPDESLEILIEHISGLLPGKATREQILKGLK